MPAKPKNAAPSKTPDPVSAEDKIARALGLLLVRTMEQKTEQVTLLRAIGFGISEVAAMLNMTENHVKVASHAGRHKSKKKGVKPTNNASN